MEIYPFKVRFILLAVAGCALLGSDPARAQCRNGAWKVEKKNLSSGSVNPGERLDIFYGSYWAHLGLSGEARISEFRFVEAPGKFKLVHSWNPERVGEVRDRSTGWEETCEGNRMVQTSLQEPMEGGRDKVQYVYTRLPTRPSSLDGVWKVQIENKSSQSRLHNEITVIRFGNYVAWFHQPQGEALTSSLVQLVSANKWKVLLSTQETDVNSTVDLSIDRGEEHRASARIIQWTAASDFQLGMFTIKKGDRVSATCSPVDDEAQE